VDSADTMGARAGPTDSTWPLRPGCTSGGEGGPMRDITYAITSGRLAMACIAIGVLARAAAHTAPVGPAQDPTSFGVGEGT